MKPTALDVFVVVATLLAAVITAYAVSAAMNYSSAPQTTCCDLSLGNSTGSSPPSSESFSYATTQTVGLQFASNQSSGSELIAAYFETGLGTQAISSVSVINAFASEGNVDLVLLQSAFSIRANSCKVGVTLFQKGTFGASPCLPSTSKKLEAAFKSFDGKYYDYNIGPLALPSGNYALQVRAELNFGVQNDTISYVLFAV